jgi:hypothetical protein
LWTKWHWDRISLSSSVSPVNIIPPWLSMPIYHRRDEQ